MPSMNYKYLMDVTTSTRFRFNRNLSGLAWKIDIPSSDFAFKVFTLPQTTTGQSTINLYMYNAANERVKLATKTQTFTIRDSYYSLNVVSFKTDMQYYYEQAVNGIEVEVIGGAAILTQDVSGQYTRPFIEITTNTNFTTPTCAKLAIDQLNVDLAQKFTWESAGQTNYTLSCGSYYYTGGAEITHTPTRRLDVGEQTATLTTINRPIAYFPELQILSAPATLTFTTTQILPVITSLEPDGIPQNGSQDIAVTWASQNQSTYSLKLIQNGTLLKTYAGTSEKQATIPRNTLANGSARLELTIAYTNGLTASRVATFEVYGKPSKPVLDPTSTYNTATPTFTWTSTEQIAYKISIEDLMGTVVETETLTSTNKSYTVKTALTNNANYIVRISVKNKWDIWSDDSTKQITISFTVLTKPLITLYTDDDSAVIDISGSVPGESGFKENQLWRSIDQVNWTMVSSSLDLNDKVVDYTCKNRVLYYYKVRKVGTNGGVIDSDVKSISVSFTDFRLYNMTNQKEYLKLVCDPDTSFRRRRNTSYNVFAGCGKPTVEMGIDNFVEGSLSFFLEPQEYENLITFLTKNVVLCYKDYMGRVLYSFCVGNIDEQYVEYLDAYKVSFDLVEVDFKQEGMLFSYNKDMTVRVAYLDGTYMLDGGLMLNGVVQL